MKAYKLVSGEEITGAIDSNGDNYIVLDKPVVILLTQEGVALQAYMPYTNDGKIIVYFNAIVSETELTDALVEYYDNMHNKPKIQTPDKKIVLPS